jgi:biopolymer transport protein ExbD
MNIPRKKRKTKMAVPTAAMGDIAFLLNIFFMVASVFAKEAPGKVEEATEIDLQEIDPNVPQVVMDEDGQLWLNARECSQDDLEAAVTALLEGKEKKLVILKVDKKLTKDRFGKVFLSICKAGATIALVGKEEE